jgi:DNA polymerase-3 subunit gamma/tau
VSSEAKSFLENILKKEVYENFSLDELQLQWVAMCNRMPERLSGIAARMKNMNPVIRRMPEVEVVVPNEIIKDEMEQIRGSIVNTLKIYLRNNKITLSLSVADQTEREVVLSRRQQFDLMTSKNPAIERLRKEFGLELV